MAEAWRDQVLHGFLAQVVIDAEDLLLGEYPADVVVDLARRFEIAAERLFEHDAAARCDESGRAEVLADAGEPARRRREIEQIGRASCRGRGGQDVLSYVVGVLLKKK